LQDLHCRSSQTQSTDSFRPKFHSFAALVTIKKLFKGLSDAIFGGRRTYHSSSEQFDDKWMVHLVKQVFLTEDVPLFAELRDLFAIHRLDSYYFASGLDG